MSERSLRLVHELIADQALAQPQAVAVSFEGQSLTYAQLDARANQVAEQLKALDVRPNQLVGVMLERSLDMVVALLGVLKSGAAYLPLEPSTPDERLIFQLNDARPAVVLCSAAHAVRARGTQSPVLLLDDCWRASLSPVSFTPARACTSDDLAYVIYTSGSTGRPKGCQVTHHNLARLFTATRPWFGFGPDSVWTLFHSFAFDFSVWEIFGALCHGGRLVVVPHEVSRSPKDFHALLVREGVTVLNQTPSAFRGLIEADLKSDMPASALSLRHVIFGGEALELQMLRPWITRHGDRQPQLVNMYGITETTVHVTYRPISLADLDRGLGSVIGTPLPDLQLHVLGPDLKSVAEGEVGEIFVGGEGVCRGYLNRPELTAERFIAWSAQAQAPAVRLYKSGDLARLLPGGDLEYLGRSDQQVKIRGFRIETGEIESQLARHPGVKGAAVVARLEVPGDEPRLVAYIVPADPAASHAELRTHLRRSLPDYMVPSAFVNVAVLPLTENGKLDRNALPAPSLPRPDTGHPHVPPANALEQSVCECFDMVLGLQGVGAADNFFELGGHSLLALRALAALEAKGVQHASIAMFFRDPTPRGIAAALVAQGADARVALPARAAMTTEPVAVVAVAGRFPGASDVEQFWLNLCQGVESITFFGDELDPSLPPALRDDLNYVRARGVLDHVEDFDAAFFGIMPNEAALMDPQQRIFLELCWECLERGGYAPGTTALPVGVFAGTYNNSYWPKHVAGRPDLVEQVGEFQVMLGNEKDFVATRVAHRLNLTGPALSIHTACSTSLVAIAEAFHQLRSHRCDMALAGGAAVTCPPRSGYLYQEGAMLSPDGHTRSFDVNAQGTVFSDGAAVVLLKRLSDALADGDPVIAVIRGAAVNNDGGLKASFTAPRVDGQAAVISAALRDAGVDARSISYVETHGTATPLGDPVEIEALTQAYRAYTPDSAFCRIGSVKSNLGHLVAAAGATGLIKTALALDQERLPPSLHFKTPNPHLGLAASPFVVNDRLHEWPRGDTPRRAGVSAFGVGGTNAHVILEEAPARADSPAAEGPQLLPVSARSATALRLALQRLADHLVQQPEINLADVAHTLQVGRTPFPHRAAVVASNVADAVAALVQPDARWRTSHRVLPATPQVVMLFPGQGAQYAGMGRELYAHEPQFRAAFDECADALQAELPRDLRTLVMHGDIESLRPTAITQPALFAIEYALARVWQSLGIQPVAMVGHSVGEFVAAALAGVMPVADAARLVARRGRLMQTLPAGGMLSVRIGAADLSSLLPAGLVIAAENSPKACVVAGPSAELEAFGKTLEARGVPVRLLQTSHAFHSPMMDPAVAPFEDEVLKVVLSAPTLPIISTLTGTLLQPQEAMQAHYWGRHLREGVRFSPALVDAMSRFEQAVFLEVGPRDMLTSLARQHGSAGTSAPHAVASLSDDVADERSALRLATGRLWCMGTSLSLSPPEPQPRRRLRLPTYPFERKRLWVEACASPTDTLPTALALEPATMPANPPPAATPAPSETTALRQRLGEILEEVSGVEIGPDEADIRFVELGLDSLSLTQVALQLKRRVGVEVSFRQMMQSLRTLNALTDYVQAQSPSTIAAPAASAAESQVAKPMGAASAPHRLATNVASGAPAHPTLVQQVIEQQMQLMAQQLALLQGSAASALPEPSPPAAVSPPAPATVLPAASALPAEPAAPWIKYDAKTAFGAIARIHTAQDTTLTDRQQARLDAFIRRYVDRTVKSKAYTVAHRPHLADPRVVNGFRPQTKEIVYQIVVDRSQGAKVWDIDGNEYVDALNGFGMNMFGWSPAFVQQAVREQLDRGYEIGPQHPLAGSVAQQVCELTGFDRAALCNTGSEAVMGTIRIARTITGRSLIVIFTGSYHGIFDEVIVRGTKKLRSVPAAPGILPNTSENVLVLDYGTPESLQIIRERAADIAAVLVEPVQTRRPDFQPKEFLQSLRELTRQTGMVLIFDEVVTGFRVHPRGAQGVFGIEADLASYGKVVGGGFPIGVIAGRREFMDALDGGAWQYGDDSIPSVGVTYFAGTFVRHPLALAAAQAMLQHLKDAGAALQQSLNASTQGLADEINRYCVAVGAPVEVRHFGSFWKTFFTEDHPLQDLLFAMMRSRGVHILDNFPCFLTTAHAQADVALIVKAFCDSVHEMQEAGFLPSRRPAAPTSFDASRPPVPGARLGTDPQGRPAWYVPHPEQADKYVKVSP